MTTEQTAQQLELAAQIIRTGHPFEVRHDASGQWHDSLGINPAQAVLQDWHLRPILATPPDDRPLHNPNNLTAEQVGAGWRLTVADEVATNKEYWHKTERRWYSSSLYDETVTYRLPLSVPWPEPQPDPYAALKKAHAEGKVIQSFNHGRSIWQDCPSPAFEGGTDYRIKPEAPPFQLPPPPPGMQWHRTDGWEEGDLPQGMRPLILDEISPPTDEIKRPYGWVALDAPGDCPELPAKEHTDPCRTRRPLTFTHAGKTWTWHRPGDPMPCGGEMILQILLSDGEANRDFAQAKFWDWEAEDKESDVKIIGWRYADEKKTVPLGPKDVPPCCAFRRQNESSDYIMPTSAYVGGIYGHDEIVFRHTWEYLKEHYQINRSIPLTGKWNPDAWEPCHKTI